MRSQNLQVLDHLKRYGSITPKTADKSYAIIFNGDDDDDDDEDEDTIYHPYFADCTCEHPREDHSWGFCKIKDCKCKGGWEE